MAEIEIFLQGDGISDITLVRIPENGMVKDVVKAARELGVHATEESPLNVLVEDGEKPLAHETSLAEAGISRRSRIHVHCCRRIETSVNFNAKEGKRQFRPSATIRRVKRWAAREFGLTRVDATEHILQICGSTTRPDEDIHLGSLASFPDCVVCFDLVPKQRIEG